MTFSLENAGQGSVLPMLRSIRLILSLLASGKSGSLVSSCNGVDAQVLFFCLYVFIYKAFAGFSCQN